MSDELLKRLIPIKTDEDSEVCELLSAMLYNVKLKDINSITIAMDVMRGLQKYLDTGIPREAANVWIETLSKFGKHKDSAKGYEEHIGWRKRNADRAAPKLEKEN